MVSKSLLSLICDAFHSGCFSPASYIVLTFFFLISIQVFLFPWWQSNKGALTARTRSVWHLTDTVQCSRKKTGICMLRAITKEEGLCWSCVQVWAVQCWKVQPYGVNTDILHPHTYAECHRSPDFQWENASRLHNNRPTVWNLFYRIADSVHSWNCLVCTTKSLL